MLSGECWDMTQTGEFSITDTAFETDYIDIMDKFTSDEELDISEFCHWPYCGERQAITDHL